MIENNRFNLKTLPHSSLEVSNLRDLVSETRTAITKLDQLVDSVPDKEKFLAPFIWSEAAYSSRIENCIASMLDIAFYAATNSTVNIAQDVEEVYNCKLAIDYANQKIMQKKNLNLEFMKEIHKVLLSRVAEEKFPGEIRPIDVYIGGGILTDIYYPPSYKNISKYLHNLEEFIATNDYDPIIQAAIIHGQFELIHPFVDGNGRVGRNIIPLCMVANNICKYPMMYCSKSILNQQGKYYSRLSRLSTHDDWEFWIRFMLNIFLETAESSFDYLRSFLRLHKEYSDKFSAVTNSNEAVKILDTLFHYPIINADFLVNKKKFNNLEDASHLLKILEQAELINVINNNKLQTKCKQYFFWLLSDQIKSYHDVEMHIVE